ncbi:MAG: outer membrane protein assembly factor BamC [Pseudomonadota bacterium]|jgi:outer membrane protein assembly factor BamC
MSFARKPFQASRLLSSLMALSVVTAVTGCSTVGDMLEPEKIDYKSVSKSAKNNKLDVPPDLTTPKGDSRYTVSNNPSGTATASDYSAQRGTGAAASTSATAGAAAATPKPTGEGAVAPAANVEAGLRIERAGKQRWLVAKQAPDVLWPKLKTFWEDQGFQLVILKPEAGLMETEWAENRAKIPKDFIREALGKVFDGLYSTSERDKFRTRLERTADGSTEIYISHRGLEEKMQGQAMNQSVVWTNRPSDPDLEAEFLSRLMAALSGRDIKSAKADVKAATSAADRARIVKDGGISFVQVDEGFDRAWRRVGLALDRVGFTVEDRDRTGGVYFVRYVDQETDAAKKSDGFFSRLFSSKKDDDKLAQRYRIEVKGTGESSRVSVKDDKGAVSANDTAGRILSLLNEQLK